MGKTMNLLPSLFRSGSRSETGQPWQWPSCTHQPKTLSFRATTATDDIIKTVNSIYFDPTAAAEIETTPDSWFTTSSESASFSTESDDCFAGEEAADVILRGIRSERLLFKPSGCSSSSSILSSESEKLPFEESVALAMESEDPYEDFRRSMEEMVETHGLKDWERLEELLGWYLKVNGKVNHDFIITAFVDLLVGIASSSSSSMEDVASCFSSADSSFSDPMLSASDRKQVDHHHDEDDDATESAMP